MGDKAGRLLVQQLKSRSGGSDKSLIIQVQPPVPGEINRTSQGVVFPSLRFRDNSFNHHNSSQLDTLKIFDGFSLEF